MSDHIYKKVEIVGSSTTTIEDAIRNATAKAAQSIRNMRWLEVDEIRAELDGGDVQHWQVTVKVGFTLDE